MAFPDKDLLYVVGPFACNEGTSSAVLKRNRKATGIIHCMCQTKFCGLLRPLLTIPIWNQQVYLRLCVSTIPKFVQLCQLPSQHSLTALVMNRRLCCSIPTRMCWWALNHWKHHVAHRHECRICPPPLYLPLPPKWYTASSSVLSEMKILAWFKAILLFSSGPEFTSTLQGLLIIHSGVNSP